MVFSTTTDVVPVYVVVAVEQDRFTVFDGAAQTSHGLLHPGEAARIVHMLDRGMKEALNGSAISDASRPQDTLGERSPGELIGQCWRVVPAGRARHQFFE